MALKLNVAEGTVIRIGPDCAVTVEKIRGKAGRVFLTVQAPADVRVSWAGSGDKPATHKQQENG